MTFEVGDIVEANQILDGRDDFYGHITYALTGDKLKVLRVMSPVSYEVQKVRGGDAFHARATELDLIRPVHGDQNLVHAIRIEHSWNRVGKVDAWIRVAKILRLYKQKKHRGFYLDVEELNNNRGFRVKVYRDVQ